MSVPKSVVFVMVWLMVWIISPMVRADDTPYLVPQIVFVGDRAKLVAPLGMADEHGALGKQSIDIPETSGDLVIHNIYLERRSGKILLNIEFTAYRPGEIDLPVIPIPGFFEFIGLKVTIASIVSPAHQSMTLAAPASPLLAPGTVSLIYGSAIVIILFLIFGIGLRLFWTSRFINARKKLLRRYYIIRMKGFIARLRKNGGKRGGGDGAVVDLLSSEFRRFLTRFTGVDCLAMSAGEFAALEIGDAGQPLTGLFGRWDTLRFNAASIAPLDITDALDDALGFINNLVQNGEKEEKREKGEKGEKDGL